jgi:hypothetical protein
MKAQCSSPACRVGFGLTRESGQGYYSLSMHPADPTQRGLEITVSKRTNTCMYKGLPFTAARHQQLSWSNIPFQRLVYRLQAFFLNSIEFRLTHRNVEAQFEEEIRKLEQITHAPLHLLHHQHKLCHDSSCTKNPPELKRIIGIDFDTTNTACTSPTLNSTLQYFAYNSQCKTACSGDTTKRAGKPQYSVVHSLH